MSAEHLINDDLPDDSLPAKVPSPPEKPNYYDLMTLRLEAGSRLARALYTLKSANVIDWREDFSNALSNALSTAEKHWEDICMGIVPARQSDSEGSTIVLRPDLPACVEAFRIIVMEHAQREALERECKFIISHAEGFKILTRTQQLYIEPKHVCDGTCDHDSKTL